MCPRMNSYPMMRVVVVVHLWTLAPIKEEKKAENTASGWCDMCCHSASLLIISSFDTS